MPGISDAISAFFVGLGSKRIRYISRSANTPASVAHTVRYDDAQSTTDEVATFSLRHRLPLPNGCTFSILSLILLSMMAVFLKRIAKARDGEKFSDGSPRFGVRMLPGPSRASHVKGILHIIILFSFSESTFKITARKSPRVYTEAPPQSRHTSLLASQRQGLTKQKRALFQR